MKRIAVWIFYGIGALAIGYLALYAYAAFTGHDLQPGDPIHIFRKPDAPDYSRRAFKYCRHSGAMPAGPRKARSEDRLRIEPQMCNCASESLGGVLITPSRRSVDIRRRPRA